VTTLFDIAGVQARIFTLPKRPPFMIAPDLAEVYGKRTKDLAEAVSRNPDRFPEDFCFRLTEAEEEQMWPHFAATSLKKRADVRPLVFTHAGAYALSAVLKTPTAAQVSVIVHRAFAAMEAQALTDARFMLAKLRSDVIVKKQIYSRIRLAADEGWDIDRLWRETSYPKHRLESAVRELVAMRILAEPLAGMQRDLFADA
jgi:hypothetical protein